MSVEPVPNPEERILDTIDVLKQSWYKTVSVFDDFSSGRRRQIEICIGLLLDRPSNEVRVALTVGQL